jgi:hypothetical protein
MTIQSCWEFLTCCSNCFRAKQEGADAATSRREAPKEMRCYVATLSCDDSCGDMMNPTSMLTSQSTDRAQTERRQSTANHSGLFLLGLIN